MLARAAERYPRLTLWFVVTALGLAMLVGNIRWLVGGIVRMMELWLILGITLCSGFFFSTFLVNYWGDYNPLLRVVAGLLWLASAVACFARYGYLNAGVVRKEYYDIPTAKVLAAQKSADGSTWNIWLTQNTFRDEVMHMLYQLPANLVRVWTNSGELALHRMDGVGEDYQYILMIQED